MSLFKRARFAQRALWTLFVVFLLGLAGCAPAPAADLPGPTAPPTLGDAETVARAFLDGWVKGDFEAMYGLLSPRSLITPREAFTELYRQAETTMRLAEQDAKGYEILPDLTKRQGSTAIVGYNMRFTSTLLGQFTDPNRALRLVLTPRGWRVAWSTMDIFEGLAGGAQLQLDRVPPIRGSIYDRSGKIIARDGVTHWAVRLLTRQYPTGRPEDCWQALATVFRLYKGDFERFREQTNQDYGYTIGVMSNEDAQVIRPQLERVCLLQWVEQTSRFYFGGGLGTQTVGFIGPMTPEQEQTNPQLAPGSLVGQFGVERVWQSALSGSSGADLVIRQPDGLLIRTIHSSGSARGQDVYLSIDRDLQLRVEQAISGAYNAANWAPQANGADKQRLIWGAATVVIDVKTGAVLALASFPEVSPDAWRLDTTFDVDTISRYVAARATVNHATEELYPLGSVMKVVSTAAAAGSGAYKMNELLDCRGTLKSPDDGRILTDWIYLEPGRTPNYHGVINLHQALTSSCDIYFWNVAERLNGINPNLLHDYAERMGLGVRTGIDTINELEGVIPNPAWTRANEGRAWGVGDSLNIVIGQGSMKVTVLQAARMIAAVADGNLLRTPYLVTKVGYPDQTPTHELQQTPPVELGIDEEVLDGVRLGLCEVTTNDKLGTAVWVFKGWPHQQIQVCGKTGTAQSGTAFPHGWFVAYAGPRGEPPEIAMATLVLYSREGSETGGPISRRIIESYYGLSQAPWPAYWSEPYEVMPAPGLSGGQ